MEKKENLLALYELLKLKYINWLNYIRNNPNLSQEEVIDHYKNLKDLKTLEKQLDHILFKRR